MLKNPKMCKDGYLPNLVITSDHMAHFPARFHNDLQLFISNEDEIVERISTAERNGL